MIIAFGSPLWLHLQVTELFTFFRLLNRWEIFFLIPSSLIFIRSLFSIVITFKLNLVRRILSKFAVSIDKTLEDL